MITKLNENIQKIETSLIRRFNDKAREKNAELFLTLGEPAFDTPDCVKQACIKALENNHTHYCPNTGIKELREKVALFEKEKNNLNYTADEVMITNGSTEALCCALFTMLQPGDEVIIPTPAFLLYEMIITYAGAKAVFMDMSDNDFQISKEMLDQYVTDKTKAIILTSPNNPSGTIFNQDTLQNVYDKVKGKDIFVICDECYNQLVYTPTQPKSFCHFEDLKDQIIVCQSFSKPYSMTGWRLGYMLAPTYIIEHAQKAHQFMTVSAVTFIQYAGMEALNFDVSEFTEIYRKRRDYAYDRLVKMGMEVIKPDGTFYIFPSIKKFGMTSMEFCTRLLDEQKTVIIPGIAFGAEGNVRLSFAVDDNTLEKALDRLEIFVKGLENK
ncbi:MAG: pyridoxal phosphate-dependent aminotransferase [Clostridia bacterium]|nr:pyridoxal phosphate-dependent aminotransferase [Clostridia bacterium]